VKVVKGIVPRELANSDVEAAVALGFDNERDEHIDVWRVLHEQRDIPAWMNEA
jgi:plasmid stabilization system protein ParE